MKIKCLIVLAILCTVDALTPPSEPKKVSTREESQRAGPGLSAIAQQEAQGKSSSRFFGGISPFSNYGGYFPSPLGAFNMGGYGYPYQYLSPYGLQGGGSPFNYGGFHPGYSGFYGNGAGGYSTSQQQQQQTSQVGVSSGVGTGGFQTPFGG